MPEHLRSLVALLPLATLFLLIARPVFADAIAPADFTRRRNLWLAVTLIAFLAHNFWLYALGAGLTLLVASRGDRNRGTLFLFMMFAVPAMSKSIPGFGIVNFIFDLDYLRLLVLTVLAPAALALHRDPASAPIGRSLPDKMLIGYVVVDLLLIFLASSFTGFLRVAFLMTVDVMLPYYVLSRALRTREDFRDALASYVVASAVMATLGTFEAIKGWNLYTPLQQALDADWGYAISLTRDDDAGGYSWLRASASAGQPIAYGFALAVALGLWLHVRTRVDSGLARLVVPLLLGAGLIVSVSRGPWIGAACLLPVFYLFGPRPHLQMLKLVLLTGLAVGLLMLTPHGAKFIDVLPFVGRVDASSITYRQRLLEVFIPIILDNPVFGASGYLYSPAVESLRQGQGIIDVVNTYIGIALYNGLAGLTFFVLFFAAIAQGIRRAMARIGNSSDSSDELHVLGRCLLATLACIAVIIFTVSSVTVIPYVYWAVAGIGAAYIECVAAQYPAAGAAATLGAAAGPLAAAAPSR